MLLVWMLECSIDSKLGCTLLLPRRQHKQDMSCEILRDYCKKHFITYIACKLNMQDLTYIWPFAGIYVEPSPSTY